MHEIGFENGFSKQKNQNGFIYFLSSSFFFLPQLRFSGKYRGGDDSTGDNDEEYLNISLVLMRCRIFLDQIC